MSDSPKCEKCGLVMCQQFDDRIVDTRVYAVPNGKFVCYGCGALKERNRG